MSVQSCFVHNVLFALQVFCFKKIRFFNPCRFVFKVIEIRRCYVKVKNNIAHSVCQFSIKENSVCTFCMDQCFIFVFMSSYTLSVAQFHLTQPSQPEYFNIFFFFKNFNMIN